jgi:hypothetical protein
LQTVQCPAAQEQAGIAAPSFSGRQDASHRAAGTLKRSSAPPGQQRPVSHAPIMRPAAVRGRAAETMCCRRSSCMETIYPHVIDLYR